MSKDDKKDEFNKAVDFIQNGKQPQGCLLSWIHTVFSAGPKNDNLTNEVKLKFYGYYKQATTGPCNEKAPSRLKLVQRMKWCSAPYQRIYSFSICF